MVVMEFEWLKCFGEKVDWWDLILGWFYDFVDFLSFKVVFFDKNLVGFVVVKWDLDWSCFNFLLVNIDYGFFWVCVD